MAYDKVVDSSVLNAGLKQIADAIREKAGTSDNLAFPTAMADAIAAIEAGGGSGGAVACGSFTPAEGMATVTINHNLGEKPTFVCVWQDTYKRPTTYQIFSLILHNVGTESQMWRLSAGTASKNSTYDVSTGTENIGQSYSAVKVLSKSNVELDLTQTSSSKFISGILYSWICLVEV